MASTVEEVVKDIEKYFDRDFSKKQRVFAVNITTDLAEKKKIEPKMIISVSAFPDFAKSKLENELNARVLAWDYFDDKVALDDVIKKLGVYYSINIDLNDLYKNVDTKKPLTLVIAIFPTLTFE